MIWRARDRLLTFERQAQLMAVLNTTPDSFSDGGSFLEPDRAVDQASRLVDEGAAILDVGGESTRPGSDPVPLEEELRRVIPVIRRLRREFPEVVLSIDTYKAETARQAVVAGADIINDITALRGDPLMVKVVKETGAGVVIMHMQGTPKTMQVAPYYRDVVAEVATFLDERRAFACAQGVAFERIALDPGFGFGKRDQDNMRLIQRLDAIAAHHKQLQVWTENCRENFENRVALVGAELARLNGRDVDAMRLYERAIRSAGANGFIQNEALANEIASRFYAARGFDAVDVRHHEIHQHDVGSLRGAEIDRLLAVLRDP